MAEPGESPVSDPLTPGPGEASPDAVPGTRPETGTPRAEHSSDDHAHDDLIGFTSPASLAGVQRRAPPPEPDITDTLDDEPEQVGLFDPSVMRATPSRLSRSPEPSTDTSPFPDHDVAIPPADLPLSAGSTRPPFGRSGGIRPAPVESAEGAMGLFTIYALILFAVPTLGLAAAVALVAVTVRPLPQQALARSHFEFQKRSLWIAAIVAVIGVLLIPVSFMGVFALFLVAVWLLARGVWGLLLLVRGERIARPRQWLIAAR